jgi:hypothetical protein
MSVIETPFGFLEVGKEGLRADASQTGQTGFGIAPERFNAIDMAASPGKFIGTMVNPIMFVAFKNQAVVSAPPVSENDAFIDRRDKPLNHLEEFSFRTIGQGGTDDSSASFAKTDKRDFPRCSASANATNPSWSEVAFIHSGGNGILPMHEASKAFPEFSYSFYLMNLPVLNFVLSVAFTFLVWELRCHLLSIV